jgi:quercetin dioxygenase-like cupin family protein
MIEQIFKLTNSKQKTIERIICDENLHYNHMILPKGESLPLHKTNSNVYMYVVRGTLSISLNDQAKSVYESGTILKLSEGILMNALNEHDDILELTVVKAPAPKNI